MSIIVHHIINYALIQFSYATHISTGSKKCWLFCYQKIKALFTSFLHLVADSLYIVTYLY
jgi:hypothetical protein